ncbi:MAG: hypothetical protein AB1734_10805 [Elusimicrobiota bacterium]
MRLGIFTGFLAVSLCCPAATVRAGYEKAVAGVRVDDLQLGLVDGLLSRDGRSLSRDGGVEILLSDNALPMEMFRRAAALPSDGFLLAAKTERPASRGQGPDYGPHLKIFRLMLIDARRRAASGDRAGAEAGLLAAAGFIAQLAEQKAFTLYGAAALGECAEKAYPFFAEILRGRTPSPSYMRELAVRLGRALAAMERMPELMCAESAELEKNQLRQDLNPEKAVLERGVMPFYRRYAYRRLQNDDYFALVYSRFDAAADARASALREAFLRNDPAAAEDFVKGQLRELAAKDARGGKLGVIGGYKVTVGDAHAVRSGMADSMVHILTARNAAGYWKIFPVHHSAAARLGLLRAALAVKEYQRRRGRLPDALERVVPALLPEIPKDPFNGFAPAAYSASPRGFSLRSGDIVYED